MALLIRAIEKIALCSIWDGDIVGGAHGGWTLGVSVGRIDFEMPFRHPTSWWTCSVYPWILKIGVHGKAPKQGLRTEIMRI